ncbi:hypothetical protein HNE_0813 [Hyphomonas neptunium ATCC 15444]|uniref:Uncharacterized protein n=2 Tax=Hyphomonas TaxID=85 RepID=Q0C403_HYPNA|nr:MULTISPECIES: hypothetical protein [Hyphomonas]ABI75596.1 hypothetical protein HNE_0813 [Hyphomonas neptunium ATCC 15444]KCZ96247.1 hypothetical protein HHI_01170 [Hyphomonas hirschiana VP5]
MMNDLIAHIAKANGLAEPLARQALGILLNGADRQGAPLAAAVFRTLPGTRALAARSGSETGAPTGEIARLIELTPGGRRRVVEHMFASLRNAGLDHAAASRLLPTIGSWMQDMYGIEGLGQLGALIAHDAETSAAAAARAA